MALNIITTLKLHTQCVTRAPEIYPHMSDVSPDICPNMEKPYSIRTWYLIFKTLDRRYHLCFSRYHFTKYHHRMGLNNAKTLWAVGKKNPALWLYRYLHLVSKKVEETREQLLVKMTTYWKYFSLSFLAIYYEFWKLYK